MKEQRFIEQRRPELNRLIGEYDSLGKNSSDMLPKTKNKYSDIATDLKQKDKYLEGLSEINYRLLGLDI